MNRQNVVGSFCFYCNIVHSWQQHWFLLLQIQISNGHLGLVSGWSPLFVLNLPMQPEYASSSGNLHNPTEQQPLIKGGSSRRFEDVGYFHPSRAFYRYSILVVIALICFGSYFVYDEIQPFEDDINNVSAVKLVALISSEIKRKSFHVSSTLRSIFFSKHYSCFFWRRSGW